MRTVVLGERPAQLQALIDRRRDLGLDGHDEVWEGDYHVAPYAHTNHSFVQDELMAALRPRARARGLCTTPSFDLGEPEDFRVPDGGVHRNRPGTWSRQHGRTGRRGAVTRRRDVREVRLLRKPRRRRAAGR